MKEQPATLMPKLDRKNVLEQVKSDGGSTSYYDFPNNAKDIQDLIEYKEMNYAVANIFKACYRLGRKTGIDDEYDINKMDYFIQRLKEEVRKRNEIHEGT